MTKVKFFVLALVAVGFLSVSCERMQVKSYDEAEKTLNHQKEDSVKEPSSLPVNSTNPAPAMIKFMTASGPVAFVVEIVEFPEDRAQGLKDRESLPENNGMWFVFDKMVQDNFWMDRTNFPLDLIYVDDNMKVVHIIENTTPLSKDMLVSPVSFKHVLEINGGLATKKGIKVGDTVEKRIGAN